jgi:hypothetical protein
MTKIYSYADARELALKLLQNEASMTKFCEEHGLNYQQLMNFRTGDKTYQTILTEILKIYGYKVDKIEKVTFFHLKTPSKS